MMIATTMRLADMRRGSCCSCAGARGQPAGIITAAMPARCSEQFLSQLRRRLRREQSRRDVEHGTRAGLAAAGKAVGGARIGNQHAGGELGVDRKSTRLNSSHVKIS